MTEMWFDERTAGLIGGLMGAILGGGFGGIGGTLAGMLAPKGKGKPLVMGIFILGLAIGIVLLITCAIALIAGQPSHVWYPFGLMGFIMTAVMGGLLPVVRMRYRQAEARKLEAESLRRS